MEGLKAMLQPCDKYTLRGILVELCAMFQRDYINVPKLHEGELRIDHVQKMVRNALAKQRLAGGARKEDHTDPNKGIFVAGAVPNLFLGQHPSTIAHLNSLVRRFSEDTLKNTVVGLFALLRKDNEEDYITNDAADEIELLDIDSVRNVFYNALTDELHTVLLQQDTDRRAFAVVRGSSQKAGALQHQPAKAGGRKQAWTGLLSVSADMLALVASFLAWEEVKAQREWQTATSGREASGHHYSQYSPCGNFVLTHSGQETDDPDSSCVNLRHATSGRAKISFLGHTGFINGCCFFPDGKAIVSASDDNTLKVWNADSGSLVRTLEGHTFRVTWADVSCDSSRILSASDDGTAKLWNANTGEIQHSLWFDRAMCNCCSFSPNSTMFVVGLLPIDSGGKHVLMLYNAKTYEIQQTLEGHTDVIMSCSFAPNGTAILSGSSDSIMKLWCVTTGQLLRTLEGHTYEINSCAFSPSGMNIVSASSDGTLRLWVVSTGQQKTIDADPINAACSASFSPDGKFVLGSYMNGTVKVWSYKEKVGLISGQKM